MFTVQIINQEITTKGEKQESLKSVIKLDGFSVPFIQQITITNP